MDQNRLPKLFSSLIRQVESSPTMVLVTIVLFYLVSMVVCLPVVLILSSFLVSCSQTGTHTP